MSRDVASYHGEYKQFPLAIDWLGGVQVLVVATESGPYIGVRSVCDAIGVAYATQSAYLRDDDAQMYAGDALKRVEVETRGGRQELLFIRRREFSFWVVHISPKRVKPEVVDRLDEFRQQVMDAADRIMFGDLSPVGPSTKLVPAPQGAFTMHCLRCGAPHALEAQDGQVIWRIAE